MIDPDRFPLLNSNSLYNNAVIKEEEEEEAIKQWWIY
jgi:hypothetical protein